MTAANQSTYLSDIAAVLRTHWPANRTVNIVCHGHSVPAGYFATPMVDSMNAYPHLLHMGLKHRYPFAVINVIVSAIGGENSEAGSKRFATDVLCHRPDIITIDYGLNDRRMGLEKASQAWSVMIEEALAAKAKVLLLTPTPDSTQSGRAPIEEQKLLQEHAKQIRRLASQYSVGLVDSFKACMDYSKHHDLSDILSWGNHPNRKGHEIVAREIMRWFVAG